MGYFAGGDLEAAKKELGKALKKNEIRVAGISLPIPEQVKVINNLSRRKVIQYLGWGSVGLGLVTAGGYQLQRSSQPTPQPTATASSVQTPEVVTLQTVQFEVVTVNERGQIINRRPTQANFFTEDLGNGITLDMVEIPGGQFVMGSPPNERERESDESPQHTVTIQPFFMSKFAVTQEQYQAVMGNNPSRFKEEGEKRPVETVSWNDATQFCDTLSERTGKSYRYRLPSEAEWEYACRAGTTTPFHFGETITSDLANYDGSAIYASEPKGQYRQQTTLVGSFPPNAFSLYDMHGNVWEWCLDTWHDNYNGAPIDGSAWINNSNNDNQILLLRSGSWGFNPRDCRSAYRLRNPRDDRNDCVGFRVVVAVLRT
ncbi:SUMF1/EgtB/PvdO family nonheme iron enzyme [Scytonema sp. UIC 10036]|nr:SUMF1/EgtB/PvdO family nonheme iron enzyme [Scytonema sp. UIC 10036]